ncbi:hypothetical protein Tco_1326968 [Tanacetum coccineum]
MRIDPIMTQKEETYQVILDIIKNTTFYIAFLAFADVLEIYMQQFWLSTFAQEFKENNSLYLHLKRNCSPFSLDSDTRDNSLIYAMLTDAIKQSDSYKAFINYSTGLVPPNKTRGKGSNGNKATITLKPASVEVSDESEPELARRQTGKSMSLTKATEEEAARQVHATHERIMSLDPSQKLKASRKSSRSQPYARGLSKGTGTKPVVLDESTFILATLHERTGIKPRVPDEDEEKKEDDDADDDKSIDLEETDNEETNNEFVHDEEYVQEDDEETDDEFVHGDEHVHDDVVEEMIDAKDTKIGKDDEGITDAEKPKVTKGDLEQARKPPLISSSLYVSSGFEVPNIQSPSILIILVLVIPEPTVLLPIPKIPPVTSATTLLPPPFVSTISPVLQQTTTPIPTTPITTEAPPVTVVLNLLPASAQMVPTMVHEYLGSSLGDDLQKDSEPSKTTLAFKKTSKGDTSPTTSKTGIYALAKELNKEATYEFAPKNDWFKQPPRPPTPDPEWNKCRVIYDQPKQPWFNHMLSAAKDLLTFDELMATPIDFSKFRMNHPKIEKLTKAHLVGPVYNHLKGTCQSSIKLKPKKKYITSITKTKAARYELVAIEDMIPNLWSATKEGYEKDVAFGIKHWDSECEGDFVNLHLNDIEDMLLLVVQYKLFHLNGEVIVDLAVALSKEPHTPSFEPPGVVYEGLSHQKRLMRADELYKFLDGTLKKVCDTLHHRLRNFQLGYNNDMPKRKWSATDQKRPGIMVDQINKQMLERQILKNLERLVGARELEMDYRLMQKTI